MTNISSRLLYLLSVKSTHAHTHIVISVFLNVCELPVYRHVYNKELAEVCVLRVHLSPGFIIISVFIVVLQCTGSGRAPAVLQQFLQCCPLCLGLCDVTNILYHDF